MISNNSSFGADLSALGHTLGITGNDPALPGDPTALQETAQHLSRLGAACGRAAAGFAGIDTGRWQGAAGDGFRGFLDTSPPRWRTAADAFERAGTAVSDYARVLAEAQQQAGQAHQQLAEAAQRSQQARQAHNARVGAYNAAADAANAGGPPPGPQPPPFSDPAAEQRAAAQHQLDQARTAVQQHGAEAARAVTEAAQRAPGKPGWFSQLASTVGDALQEDARALGSMASGAGEAIGGMAQLARAVNPMDTWNMTHPAQAVHNASTLAAGMASVVTHPYQGLKTVADVDGWRSNPAHALGSCIPNAVASLAGGAGVATRAASGVRRAGTAAADAARASRASRASRAARAAERFDTAPERSAAQAAPQQPAQARWGRLPESAGPRPDITGSHTEHPGERVTTPTGRPEHTWNHHPGQHEQPWRPSTDPAPSRLGEHDPHLSTGHDPAGPHARPEHPGLDTATHQPDHHQPGQQLPCHEPGPEFEHALHHAQQHGDPIRFNQHEWDHLNPHDQLPQGLTHQPVHSYGDAAKEFLYRDLDPNDHPLFRKIQGPGADLDHLFEQGASSRHAHAPATLETLGAHMGGSGGQTPFISTTDNLAHALSRDRGFHDGVVLDIRDPGGHAIDADATFKHREGERFISHGEGEKPYLRHIPPGHIRGGWQLVEGRPRWFDNPNFDHSILGRSAS